MKPTLSRKHHSHAIRGKLCAALALALVACGDQKGGGAAADGESADDSAAGADGGAAIDTGDPAWILPDDGGAEVVPIAPDAVAAQVEAALARISGVSAAPLLSAMDAILAAGEPGCPDWYTDEDGNPYWSDTCTASSGASFSGYGLIYRYDGYSDGATTWDGFGLAVAGSLTAPDGEELAMNGYASFLQGEEESGSLTAYSTIEAGQRWSASTEPWLAEGTGPTVGWYAVGAPDGSGGAVSITARVEPEDAFTAVILDEVLFITESWGSACPQEPAGAISVLTAEGRWLDLEFDGPGWGEDAEIALCDGCGRAYEAGAALGEVCVDFSAVGSPERWPLWTGPYR
jgi:hypothetical protein